MEKMFDTGAEVPRAEAPGKERVNEPVEMDRNRAKGMLWGLIVGDAFGSPVQFCEKDDHPWITEMVACPTFGLPPGCWTDDGSMAMCIMDSYVRMGGYDLKDIGMTFVKWLDDGYLSSMEGRSFDVGGATMTSVSEIAYMGVSFLVIFLYGSLIWGIYPKYAIENHISWEGHLAGFIMGIALAIVYRHEGPQREKPDDDEDDDDFDDENPYWDVPEPPKEDLTQPRYFRH